MLHKPIVPFGFSNSLKFEIGINNMGRCKSDSVGSVNITAKCYLSQHHADKVKNSI